MTQRITKTLATLAVMATVAVPMAAFAQQGSNPFDTARNKVSTVGNAAGIGTGQDENTLLNMIGNIINVILGFLGVILLVYILYAGFLWMTAGGDKSKVETATTMIKNAVIGLVIIVAAYAISTFVLSKLVEATTGSA
jgi:hypothetical protein